MPTGQIHHSKVQRKFKTLFFLAKFTQFTNKYLTGYGKVHTVIAHSHMFLLLNFMNIHHHRMTRSDWLCTCVYTSDWMLTGYLMSNPIGCLPAILVY